MEERFAFDQIANVCKVARPDYPEALIEDVVSYADLKQSDHILEVGCGTGQATKSFAKRGFPLWRWIPDQKCSVARVRTWRASAMLSCWRRRSRHGLRTEERSD